MKKYIIFLVIVLVGFSFQTAFASIGLNPSTNPQPDLDTTIEVSCSQNQYSNNSNIFFSYSPSGSLIHTFSSCFSSNGFIYGAGGLDGSWTFFECDGSIIGGACSSMPLTLSQMQADLGVISQMSFIYGSEPEPPAVLRGVSILGGSSLSTGNGVYDKTMLTSNVSNAVQGTLNGFWPIVALVVGVILTMILSVKLFYLFRDPVK